MPIRFNGFSATKPVARLIDKSKLTYEAFFIAYDPGGKKHYKRYQKGINDEKNGLDRRTAAHACAEELWSAMKVGWNPLTTPYPKFASERSINLTSTLFTSLDDALTLKKPFLSKWSYYDYAGCVRFIKKAAIECGMSEAVLVQIKRRDIRMLLATAKEQNNWSANSRNKCLALLRSLFSALLDDERIEYNPAKSIKNEPTPKGLGYKKITDDQKDIIARELMSHHLDFFEYIMFIYDDGIRRKETLMLEMRDFNLTNREITIRPEVAKTNRERIVPITDAIMHILLRRQIWLYPSDWYLFSSDSFKPGIKAYHPNTPTNWWRDIVIRGLQIDCKMYALKHKGADDKIMAGIPLEAMKEMFGHRSYLMTEVYASAVKNQYRQQIIANAPPIAKIVEMRREAK